MPRYHITILLFCCFLNSYGAISSEILVPKDSLYVDSSKIERRQFPANFKNNYTDEAYIYERDTNSKGWYTRFKEWLAHKLNELFSLDSTKKAANMADILVNIFYILIILAVIFILVKAIMNREGRWVFGKSSDKKLTNVHDLENNIHTVDFKNLINTAVDGGDYRLAIRYYYLWILKELTNKELIDYHVDKTNNDYLNELKYGNIKDNFGYTSYLYNYIWYGEFDLEKNQYKRAIGNFKNLLKKISSE